MEYLVVDLWYINEQMTFLFLYKIKILLYLFRCFVTFELTCIEVYYNNLCHTSWILLKASTCEFFLKYAKHINTTLLISFFSYHLPLFCQFCMPLVIKYFKKVSSFALSLWFTFTKFFILLACFIFISWIFFNNIY